MYQYRKDSLALYYELTRLDFKLFVFRCYVCIPRF